MVLNVCRHIKMALKTFYVIISKQKPSRHATFSIPRIALFCNCYIKILVSFFLRENFNRTEYINFDKMLFYTPFVILLFNYSHFFFYNMSVLWPA